MALALEDIGLGAPPSTGMRMQASYELAQGPPRPDRRRPAHGRTARMIEACARAVGRIAVRHVAGLPLADNDRPSGKRRSIGRRGLMHL